MPVHPMCFISMGWSEQGIRFFGTRVTDVRCQVCAGNQSLVLWRNNKCPQTAELSLQPLGIFLNVVHLQIYGFPMASNSWPFMVWSAWYGAILTDVNSLLNVPVLPQGLLSPHSFKMTARLWATYLKVFSLRLISRVLSWSYYDISHN